uniref:Uncharacterized protein n=1 Tax=Anguilla anguilla TaxID=7936 RepID=A0A0E9X7G7_ANGAN
MQTAVIHACNMQTAVIHVCNVQTAVKHDCNIQTAVIHVCNTRQVTEGCSTDNMSVPVFGHSCGS